MSLDPELRESNSAASATIEAKSVAAVESEPPSKLGKSPKLTIISLVIVLASTFFLYYAAISPENFGVYHDDSIYVTTAKSLAEGEGYRIISLPYEPAQTKYPPFYPFLLSLIWKAYPQFPENITLLMMFSVIATLGFLAMTWRYLIRQGYATNRQALLIVGLTAFNWRMIISATSIYTEVVYAALSAGGLYLTEKYDRENKWWLGAGSGLVMGLAILTRSSGAALLIAVVVYFLLRRQWRRCLLPVGVGGIFILGWLVWSYINRTTIDGVNVAYYTSYLRDLLNVVNDLQAQGDSSKLMVWLSVIGRNALMLIVISPPVVCLGIDYSSIQYFGFVFLFIAAGFWRHVRKGLRLLHLYVVSYLVIHIFWLPYVSYDRFLIPLLPFLLLYLITELEEMTLTVWKELVSSGPMVKKVSVIVIGLALALALGIAIYHYGSGIYWRLAGVTLDKRPGVPAEDKEAIKWINENTNPSDVLVCYRDPMYFLYTGRKATRSFPMKAGTLWQKYQSLLFQIVKESDGRYLIFTSSDFEHEYQPDLQRRSFKELIEQHPEMFIPAFESANGGSTIYRIANGAG